MVLGAEGFGKSNLLSCFFNREYCRRMARQEQILIKRLAYEAGLETQQVYTFFADAVRDAAQVLLEIGEEGGLAVHPAGRRPLQDPRPALRGFRRPAGREFWVQAAEGKTDQNRAFLAARPLESVCAEQKTPSPERFEAQDSVCYVWEWPRISWRVANSLPTSMGLPRWPFMPAERTRWRSSSKALAVMATMGMRASLGSVRARIALVASMPSMTGIWMSMRTRS